MSDTTPYDESIRLLQFAAALMRVRLDPHILNKANLDQHDFQTVELKKASMLMVMRHTRYNSAGCRPYIMSEMLTPDRFEKKSISAHDQFPTLHPHLIAALFDEDVVMYSEPLDPENTAAPQWLRYKYGLAQWQQNYSQPENRTAWMTTIAGNIRHAAGFRHGQQTQPRVLDPTGLDQISRMATMIAASYKHDAKTTEAGPIEADSNSAGDDTGRGSEAAPAGTGGASEST